MDEKGRDSREMAPVKINIKKMITFYRRLELGGNNFTENRPLASQGATQIY